MVTPKMAGKRFIWMAGGTLESKSKGCVAGVHNVQRVGTSG